MLDKIRYYHYNNNMNNTLNNKEGNMRSQFIECKTRAIAARQCPWAAKIVKVEGGYRAFESIQDYNTWKNQK